jgi:hypothetical protein
MTRRERATVQAELAAAISAQSEHDFAIDARHQSEGR